MFSSFLCLWASWLGNLPYHFIVPAISLPLFYFLLPVGLWADTPAVSVHFSHLYLFWVLLANILAVLAHFISRACSAHLLLFTYFTLIDFLLNPLDFLSPISTSLHLITFRTYWPLSQPNEFTNSFPRLSRLIYFIFTSYCFHGFITSFFGFPWSIYFFFTSYYSCELAGHYSCHSGLLSLLSYFFFSLSSYCWSSSAIRPFVKSEYQHPLKIQLYGYLTKKHTYIS